MAANLAAKIFGAAKICARKFAAKICLTEQKKTAKIMNYKMNPGDDGEKVPERIPSESCRRL
jgi:hypothetical protein